LDWRKLHENIYAFANSHGMRTEESDTNFVGGKVTIYQLVEDSKIFYELRHSKPREDHGSKLSVYSQKSGQLSITVKSRFFGGSSLKSNTALTEKMEQLLKELAQRIGTFKWVCEPHHLGWPNELRNSTVLRFECKRIDLAREHLEPIRQIHLNLLENNSV
jgi:hypothetical protein